MRQFTLVPESSDQAPPLHCLDVLGEQWTLFGDFAFVNYRTEGGHLSPDKRIALDLMGQKP